MIAAAPTVAPPGAPPAFHVMTKPRGAICNLDCAYCYYLAKERLYEGSRFKMADDLLADYIQQYIAAQQVPEVTFAWQGGEPTLMGLDFYRRAVELQRQHAKPGMQITNTLQTNATRLDDDWCQFFHDNNFLIGVSVDGPRDIHDTFRLDKGGNPTFDKVMVGIERLKRHNVDFNILTTLHAANADDPLRTYRFLRDEIGTNFMQFIPIVERENETGYQEGNRVTPRSISGRQYGNFMITVFDEWVRHDVGNVYVQLFDICLGVWFGQPANLCVFAETCGNALALEHTGDLYSCDHFVEPKHKLGNIQQRPMIELVADPRQQAFGQAKRDTLPRYCRQCDVRFICNGGCPKDRILRTPDGEAGLNFLCEGYMAFFRHIDRPMRLMAEELHWERAPSNIMAMMAEEDAATLRLQLTQAGRNDPCPCGSGRKFKQCHGRANAVAMAGDA